MPLAKTVCNFSANIVSKLYDHKDLLIAELISMTEWLDEQEILSNIALDYRVKSLDHNI